MRLRSTVTEARPTNLELFFDLVFVVVIAQPSDLIASDPTATRFLECGGTFAAVFFTWVGFTAYADRFDVDAFARAVAGAAGLGLAFAGAVLTPVATVVALVVVVVGELRFELVTLRRSSPG